MQLCMICAGDGRGSVFAGLIRPHRGKGAAAEREAVRLLALPPFLGSVGPVFGLQILINGLFLFNGFCGIFN
jgi:hypothetical protein